MATYTIDPTALAARGHQVDADVPHGRILHGVLMKPESEQYVPFLHQQVAGLGLTQLDIGEFTAVTMSDLGARLSGLRS